MNGLYPRFIGPSSQSLYPSWVSSVERLEPKPLGGGFIRIDPSEQILISKLRREDEEILSIIVAALSIENIH